MAANPAPRPVAPEPVRYVRDLLDGFGAPWALCGGWAVDAWLGTQSRDHGDVDIAVFHDDQGVIFEHLSGWALVGHDPNVPDDTSEQWNGRRLDLPAHIHVPTLKSTLATSTTLTHSRFEFEFMLEERSGHEWVLRREPRIALPPGGGAQPSPWGIPAAVPEAILFFKAGGHLAAAEIETRRETLRPQDERDLLTLLPTLGGARRHWLEGALAAAHPGHPWLPHLRPQ